MYRVAIKMKKFISVLLCIALLAGFSSCGKKEYTETSSTTNTDAKEESSITEKDSVKEENSSTDGNTTSDKGVEKTSSDGTTKKDVSTVKVTIPEGYTLLRLSWLLEDKGLCTSEEFTNAAQTANKWLDLSQYPFLKDAFTAKNVCFYLEGYIFPLTYEIPKGADAKEILKTFLNGTKTRLNSTFLQKVKNSGYSVHEILTLASIIEKEARTDEQRPMVASVLYNRLRVKMPLQCDVCINYCEGVIKIAYPDKFPTIKAYYNSKNVGLIAGPICNPGMKSINAALSPAKTDYLYFVIGSVPPYEAHYSKTYEEHDAYWQANKDRLTGKA